MNTHRAQQLVLTVALVLLLLITMACYSTACMTNKELVNWLDTGTPQPCFSSSR
jgi:hypothetical protein